MKRFNPIRFSFVLLPFISPINFYQPVFASQQYCSKNYSQLITQSEQNEKNGTKQGRPKKRQGLGSRYHNLEVVETLYITSLKVYRENKPLKINVVEY